MEIIKVNDHAFHCVLGPEELQEYGLCARDFISNNDKIQGLLQDVMQKARDQIGFNPKSDAIALKVLALPSGMIDIAFIGDLDDDISAGAIMLEALQAMAMKRLSELAQQPQTAQSKNKSDKKDNSKQNVVAIFRFNSLDETAQCCAKLYTGKPVNSDVYKDVQENKYYLIVRKGRLSKNNFRDICVKGLEYGDMIGADIVVESYIHEAFEPIVKKRAVKIMSIM